MGVPRSVARVLIAQGRVTLDDEVLTDRDIPKREGTANLGINAQWVKHDGKLVPGVNLGNSSWPFKCP